MNNKGFTLIELILSFMLVVIIVIPLFSLILSYKNRQTVESNKADLTNYKNILTYDIQKELISGFISADKEKIYNDSLNCDQVKVNKVNDITLTVCSSMGDNKIIWNGKTYALNSKVGKIGKLDYYNGGTYVTIQIPIKLTGSDVDYGIYIYAEKKG